MATQLLSTTPRDLLLDDNNDLVVGTDLSFSRGIQAVVQSIRIALQMFAGEWFLNLDAGIPYWQSILGKKPGVAIQAANQAFRAELEAADGVLKVLRCDVAYDGSTRTLSVKWQVSTALGDTPVDTIALAVGGGTVT